MGQALNELVVLVVLIQVLAGVMAALVVHHHPYVIHLTLVAAGVLEATPGMVAVALRDHHAALLVLEAVVVERLLVEQAAEAVAEAAV